MTPLGLRDSATVLCATVVLSALLAGCTPGADGASHRTRRDVAQKPATASTTSSSITTIPPIEANIPLSVDSVKSRVAPSVAFVLTQQGTGSGVVIREDLLVTNAHVTWPDRTVSLVFRNGATFQGRVIAIDPFVDLAVVDIGRLTRKPPPLVLGTTDDVSVGDSLWIVGYPLPSEFTPEPTVDAGDLTSLTDWEFSGVQWFTVAAPAIGGQSGGAIVDSQGRLVGISTFGSASSLTSISIDDVVARVDEMLQTSAVRGLEPRLLPHAGARRSWDMNLEGPWDQQLFIGWLPATVDVTVANSGGGLNLAARTIDGTEVAAGVGSLEFSPGLVFPVVVAAESESTSTAEFSASLPFIAFRDPDDGRTLSYPGTTTGVYDMGGDRDFFYLDLNVSDRVSIAVESAARTQLWVYGPDGSVVAEDVDESGFIGNSATVEVTSTVAGRYVVAVESRLTSIAGYTVVTR